MPKTDLRFLKSKDTFLGYSYQALQDYFTSKDDLIAFFEAIEGDEEKNLFLKTASFYLFLVKKGEWVLDIPGSSGTIDYLTDTYKYIAVFSLIESLQNKPYLDFFSYLLRKKTNVRFPIKDKSELETWYRKYKEEFGCVQQSIQFFMSLPPKTKKELIKNLEVKGSELAIENLANYLYEVRSKFVHEAKLIVQMSGMITVGRYENKVVVCKLSLNKLMEFFEEGLIKRFTRET